MEILYITLSLVVGFIFSHLLNKSKNVSKSDYELLTAKFNEINTQLKISEDRLLTQQQENSKLTTRFESKEAEFVNQQNEINQLKQKIAEGNAVNNSVYEALRSQKEDSQKQLEQITQLTKEINNLNSQNSTLTANNSALTEKLSTQKNEVTEIQRTARLEFEKIANQILEEKSGKFTETNKINIEALLKPLGENIDNFKKKVEETYITESKERFSLEAEVKKLVVQTDLVKNEAINLTNALKGDSKKQGNWGEMLLESVLERSGLTKGNNYFLQQTIKGEEGNDLRPDVLVKLTDGRVVIIDSKVSLVGYEKFSSADLNDDQEKYLKEHIASIRNHIDGLSKKKYDDLESALDYTMMFIPIEPAYMLAIKQDQELWSYAYSRRILLISPTNLIACLKIISDLWKKDMQSKNAMEIVKRGGALYDKFVKFTESLVDVGKHITKSKDSYDQAIVQLNTGSGNLLRQVEMLKELGVKTTKDIPNTLKSIDTEVDVFSEQEITEAEIVTSIAG